MAPYEILEAMAKLAEKNSGAKYSITPYAFGYIPFKNGKNLCGQVGDSFCQVARWLVDEMESAVNTY